MNRHRKGRNPNFLSCVAVPQEKACRMYPARTLKLVWWLRPEGWKEASIRQYQRILVAWSLSGMPFFLGNKR